MLELIDERYYLNGRLIGGDYFGEVRCTKIKGLCLNKDALVGLQFTGLVKVRELVRGFEWNGFQWDACRKTIFDCIGTAYLQACFQQEYREFRAHYGDAHDRNILFEVLPFGIGKVSLYRKNCAGSWEWVSVRLRGVDLR